ncbi:hypothetical protein V8G54_012384 [Vigna mungo]|uniref:Uncharacterized protein n=1 Tax=Vigna mungo TaxID=3915 RepID=A0AAQ3NST8_VIGMU
MQEIKEMLQEIKIHIKGLGRSKESVMKVQKEGSDEEEMKEDRGEQNWRLAYNCMEGGTIYWLRVWKNKTKKLYWKGLKEALIMGFGGRDRGSVFEKKRETEAAILSVDGFARIRGQDKTEENICGEEGNDENCDGDMGSRNREFKRRFYTGSASMPTSSVLPIPGSKCTIMVKGFKTWHQKSNNLSWKNLATNLLKRVEGNRRSMLCDSWAAITQIVSVQILHESLQVDGAAVESVVATRVDEVKKEWKSLEEDLPPPKHPNLNWRAASSGFPSYGNRLMKRSHEIQLSDSNHEDKVVMIGYRVIGYNGFKLEGGKIIECIHCKSGLWPEEGGYALNQGGYAPNLFFEPNSVCRESNDMYGNVQKTRTMYTLQNELCVQ